MSGHPNKFKIGFSDIGGIYIGKNIQSSFHKHYAITVLLSFGEPFIITTLDQKQALYKVAIIQKNISYNLQTSENDYVAFIHIVPYSTNGIILSNDKKAIQKLEVGPFKELLKKLNLWFNSGENNVTKVEQLLDEVAAIPKTSTNKKVIIDERIKKAST